MRKLTVLLMVLGLALMATSVQAGLTNEVLNGDFAGGTTANWVNPVPNHGTMSVFPNGGFNYAGTTGAFFDEKGMSQITDDKLGGGWLDNGTAKKVWFSFDAVVNNGFGEAYLFYYGLAGAPTPLGSPDNPGAGWVELIDGETNGLVLASGHYSAYGVLPVQPEWFAVAFEAQVDPVTGTVGFTNIELKGQCVPVPPAVWLFGSGLLGLVGLRRRVSK